MGKGRLRPRSQFLMVDQIFILSEEGLLKSSSSGKLSVNRGAVLKHILRSMHRMMQSSGTSEGLRGLLDSSLLNSTKKILANREIFGPNCLAIGMSAGTGSTLSYNVPF